MGRGFPLSAPAPGLLGLRPISCIALPTLDSLPPFFPLEPVPCVRFRGIRVLWVPRERQAQWVPQAQQENLVPMV